jgi:CubicO group peptidase (beta-lactamase class C family)
VLLERHGKVVIERYYQGTRPSDRLPIFSITKSVTSALVGMAIADGRLSGVDERLPWRRQVTVGQLLSMTAGYAPSVSFKRTDPESLADRPLLNRPGTFAYDSGSMDLLADLIARATGMPAAAYARRRLFGPMGITAERWPGSRGSSGLLLRPRDLLAFGQLYLDGGVWHGSASSRRAGSECRRARTLSSAADCTTGSAGGSGRARMPATAISDRCWRFPGRDEVVLVTSSREDADPLALVRRLTRG